jgi:hypothetical protein
LKQLQAASCKLKVKSCKPSESALTCSLSLEAYSCFIQDFGAFSYNGITFGIAACNAAMRLLDAG